MQVSINFYKSLPPDTSFTKGLRKLAERYGGDFAWIGMRSGISVGRLSYANAFDLASQFMRVTGKFGLDHASIVRVDVGHDQPSSSFEEAEESLMRMKAQRQG